MLWLDEVLKNISGMFNVKRQFQRGMLIVSNYSSCLFYCFKGSIK